MQPISILVSHIPGEGKAGWTDILVLRSSWPAEIKGIRGQVEKLSNPILAFSEYKPNQGKVVTTELYSSHIIQCFSREVNILVCSPWGKTRRVLESLTANTLSVPWLNSQCSLCALLFRCVLLPTPPSSLWASGAVRAPGQEPDKHHVGSPGHVHVHLWQTLGQVAVTVHLVEPGETGTWSFTAAAASIR